MIWRLYYYLFFIIPCVCSLDEDLSSNNLFKIDSDGEVEPGGLTTEQSLAVTDRDSLLVAEGLQNINASDISLENGTDDVLNPMYSLYDSQDNRTELDSDDVEILRFAGVLTST